MDINSKEFKSKYKPLFKKGYCKECIGILISPYTKKDICKKCQEIFEKEIKGEQDGESTSIEE